MQEKKIMVHTKVKKKIDLRFSVLLILGATIYVHLPRSAIPIC